MGEQAQSARDPVSKCSVSNREKRHFIFISEGLIIDIYLCFSLLFSLNMSSLLVLSGRYRIQREVVERGDKKEAVLLVLWNLSYCCVLFFFFFLSYVPSEQANFKCYSLFEKREGIFMLFSFLISLQPLHEFPLYLLATLLPLKILFLFSF